MAINIPDKLKSQNIYEYGIVDIKESSGQKQVNNIKDLFTLSDNILSSNLSNPIDAIG